MSLARNFIWGDQGKEVLREAVRLDQLSQRVCGDGSCAHRGRLRLVVRHANAVNIALNVLVLAQISAARAVPLRTATGFPEYSHSAQSAAATLVFCSAGKNKN